MVKRPAERDESLSHAHHVQKKKPFDVAFTGRIPSCWAMIYIDDNGNIQETSNLPSSVFTEETFQEFRNASEQTDDASDDKIALKISETKNVTAYYESAFERFQQLNCRQIAKEFIKEIQPHKQVKHPYNGGVDSVPESTKPDWWPDDVPHKEPDHLKKEFRIKLLVHIIQDLPNGITVDKLQEIAKDNRRRLRSPKTVEILYEIFSVRRSQEQFLQAKIDKETVIYIVDHKKTKKNKSGSDDEPKDDAENLKIPDDTPEVQESHDGSPLSSRLNFENQGEQMQSQPSQHQGLATPTNLTTAYDNYALYNMNAPTSFSEDFNQNLFAPVHDYSGGNHPTHQPQLVNHAVLQFPPPVQHQLLCHPESGVPPMPDPSIYSGIPGNSQQNDPALQPVQQSQLMTTHPTPQYFSV